MTNKSIQKSIEQITRAVKRWLVPITVVLLLSIFTTLSLIESSRQSATADEVAHIPAGISYVQTRDLRINPEHPVLVKYLSGLSAQAFAHPTLKQDWSTWKHPDEWFFGRQLLYSTRQNNADNIVFWARIPILILAIGLGLIIFFWASAMFGQTAGLAALALYSLDPTMITFSHLVLFDLPMATFVAASSFCLWIGHKKHQVWWYILAGFFLGLALTAKASALSFVLLVPLLLGPATSKIKGSVTQQVRFFISRLSLVYCATFITIWLTYLVVLGNRVRHGAGLLPAAFAYALNQGQARFLATKPMYLDGHLSAQGTWWYFSGSILAKSTLAFLFILLVGLIYAFKKKQNWFSDTKVYLLAPIIIILSYASLSKFDIGLRLIFIIYPFMFILAGYAASVILKNSRKSKVWICAVLIYYIFTLVTTFPNYLAYSNEIFGGRTKGYRYLADSNLDIGQGLKELKNYDTKHHIKNMQIIYFGEAIPEYYGLKTVSEGVVNLSRAGLNKVIPPNGGWLAISTSIADYCGLHQLNYKIRGIYPVDLVAGSILIYKLPPRTT